MSQTEPMVAAIRAHTYWLQCFRRELTPRQRRRFQHKANRALRTRAVASGSSVETGEQPNV